MTNNSCKKENSSHCFSSILRQMVCGQNLPTHPSSCEPFILENTGKATTCSNPSRKNGPNSSQIQVQVQVQTRGQAQGPSIVARLMGLESLPENSNSYESLFRSKSLNSLHFYPDFNQTRAWFHRRARTSASFHEQSHNNLLAKIDENLEQNGCLESKKPQKGSHMKQKKEGSRENVVTLKGNERRISRKIVNNNKKKYEQRFSNSENTSGSTSSSISNRIGKYNLRERNNNNNNNNNNEKKKVSVIKKKDKKVKINDNVSIHNVTSMRMVDNNKEEFVNIEFQSDATSRSPVSVLDHHHCHLFDSPTKEDERQVNSHSTSEAMTVPKSKKKDKSPKKMGHKQKLDKAEVAHYCLGFVAQIYNVVEDHVRDPKWMTKYQRSKAHFTDELCVHFGDEMLDFLLLELMYELLTE